MKKKSRIVEQLKKTLAAAAVIAGCTGTVDATENEPGLNGTHPFFYPASNREKWQPASQSSRRARIFRAKIKQAEEVLQEPIPQPTASLFMEFVRNGNRANYEKVYFARRKNLIQLVLAECAEYKGRFLDRIADYLWAITGEHTWCLPAHVPERCNDGLPDLPYEFVDLFAAETGMDLALTLELLEPELNKVSPNLVAEVKRNLFRRIIEPLEIKPFPFWWLKATHNWRAWCCGNTLATVKVVLKDQPERQKKLVAMLKNAMDDFVKIYPEDGCCDEGPHYWGKSPANILRFYEQLGIPMNRPKHARMAEYILNVRLTRSHFANFADSSPKFPLPGSVCYRFGELLGNDQLKQFGLDAAMRNEAIDTNYSDIFTELTNIFWLPDIAKAEQPELKDNCHYYDYRQMLFLRDRGTSLAAKRGFLGNHYHMDVGQFIIYRDELPVVIDPGIGAYSKDTFNANRYKNWFINCDGHNIPQFNGIAQSDHPERDAAAAEVIRDAKRCVFKMDLTSAYLKEAQLVQCLRTITYDYTDQSIGIDDVWELSRADNTVRIPLYTPQEVKIDGNVITIGNMRLEITGKNCTATCTAVPMTDPGLPRHWGDRLHRIDLTVKCGKQGGCKLHFTPLKKEKAAQTK